MPQFDLDRVGPDAFSGVVRARTAIGSVSEAANVDLETVELVETDDPAGWIEVHVNGVAQGRVRDHNRMRFRRD